MAYRLRHRHRHPRRHSRRSTMMWRSIPTIWWYAAVAMPTIQRSIPIIWWCPAVGPWRPTTTMRVYIKRTREWEAMHHPQSKPPADTTNNTQPQQHPEAESAPSHSQNVQTVNQLSFSHSPASLSVSLTHLLRSNVVVVALTPPIFLFFAHGV